MQIKPRLGLSSSKDLVLHSNLCSPLTELAAIPVAFLPPSRRAAMRQAGQEVTSCSTFNICQGLAGSEVSPQKRCACLTSLSDKRKEHSCLVPTLHLTWATLLTYHKSPIRSRASIGNGAARRGSVYTVLTAAPTQQEVLYTLSAEAWLGTNWLLL